MELGIQDSERDRERRGTAAGTAADPIRAEAWARGTLAAITVTVYSIAIAMLMAHLDRPDAAAPARKPRPTPSRAVLHARFVRQEAGADAASRLRAGSRGSGASARTGRGHDQRRSAAGSCGRRPGTASLVESAVGDRSTSGFRADRRLVSQRRRSGAGSPTRSRLCRPWPGVADRQPHGVERYRLDAVLALVVQHTSFSNRTPELRLAGKWKRGLVRKFPRFSAVACELIIGQSVSLIVGHRNMPGQVHAVMKQSEDIDDSTFRFLENHKMATFSALPSHMQGADA